MRLKKLKTTFAQELGVDEIPCPDGNKKVKFDNQSTTERRLFSIKSKTETFPIL
jgi:hypothetical protein